MDSLSPSIVLCAHAEPLLDGRRAVVFGDSSAGLAEELLERGARTVHVYDPEPGRAAVSAGKNREKQISVVPLDEADVAIRDGAFDVAIVPDLSAAADAAALLKRVRRALSGRGVAVVASPNPEVRARLLPGTGGARASALGYYELYDAVSAEFPEVRMLGQTPFVGYAVVDFAPEGEPDIAIDSGLLPGGAEEPEWFIAVAGREPVATDAFGIVQLPSSQIASGKTADDVAEQLRLARAAEEKLVARVAALEAEAAALRASAGKPHPAEERADAAERQLRQVATELADLRKRAEAAEARADGTAKELGTLRTSAGNAERAQGDAAKARKELEQLGAQLRASEETRGRLEKQLAAEKADLEKRSAAQASGKSELEKRAQVLAAEKADLEKRLAASSALAGEKKALAEDLARAQAEVGALVKKLEASDALVKKLTAAQGADGPDELAQLEATLRERGERVRRLEADLREAERVGKELLREVTRSNAAPPHADPHVAADNARLRADLEAAGWTIQELESRLSGGGAPS